MSNIFITGGSGFVGQNLIPLLQAKGHRVYALARSESSMAKVRNMGAIPVQDDLIALSESTREALRHCEAVIHSAALMDFTYDPKPYYAINVDATRSLLEMAQEEGVKKFVYISAAPVVPGSPIEDLTEDQTQPGLPRSLYPKTKALGEREVLAANRPGFQTVSLRPPAIWGPNNPHYEKLFEMARQGNWIWIGGGKHHLSTIHVENLAAAILAALASEQGGEAYFVTDGDKRSFKHTFGALFRAYNLAPGEKSLPRWAAWSIAQMLGGIWKMVGLKSRPPISPLMIRLMGTEFTVSDEKARRELGYQPVVSFEEGIAALKGTKEVRNETPIS